MPLPKLIARKRWLMIIGSFALAALLLCLALLSQANRLPAPRRFEALTFSQPGPYLVGMDLSVIDDDPPLELSVWYPAVGNENPELPIVYSYEVKFRRPLGTISVATFEGQALPGTPMDRSKALYPIVVLSPGFSIKPGAYAWLAEHLASYGFVVLSPNHNEQLDPENQLWRSAITRPQDILAILTFLDEQVREGGSLEGLIDKDTVAVVGHSYGGYTALASAGARIDTKSLQTLCEGVQNSDEPGAWLCGKLVQHLEEMADLAGLDTVPEGLWPAWAAERVDTIVPMAGDALFFGQPGLAELTVPVLAIGGTADEDSPFAWGTNPSYELTSSKRKAMVGLVGAGHMIFTGPCEKIPWYLKLFSGEFCADPSWDRNDVHAITKHFVTAFLLTELKDDADAVSGLLIDEAEIPGLDYQVVGY